ncbi:hypothetical protein J7481_04855 [Labrenzia sp. R4_2]|uniref:hypothetical protein n=1 Tax=Labrenzia sp. R4_2 TaxID=2821107 RepID=UPI001AD99FC3|nr:hypothetical protein [Labrenzia sp. R4_2]MBO9418818.1 hypothetical protein [Labrenzia sp. R4_2]
MDCRIKPSNYEIIRLLYTKRLKPIPATFGKTTPSITSGVILGLDPRIHAVPGLLDQSQYLTDAL